MAEIKSKKVEPRQVNLEYIKDKDMELVHGRFHFHERKYDTLPLKTRLHKGWWYEKDLEDGKEYDLPRGIVRHLNRTGRYTVHEFHQDPNGGPAMDIGRVIARYSFESLEFENMPDIEPENDTIVTARPL